MKDFAAILKPFVPVSSSHPASTGSSCIRFTPDSSKLVLATTLSSFVLVVDLSEEQPKVLRRFEHHRIKDMYTNGRVLRGKLASLRNNGESRRQGEVGGHVDMTEPSSLSHPNEDEGEEDDISSDADDAVAIANINRIAISADGQWLATSDNRGRLHIFNLDSISVRFPFTSYC